MSRFVCCRRVGARHDPVGDSARLQRADYPSRNVTLVVPYPPGGGVDAMARVVAAKLSDAFHQQFIVDNRPGAGGTIGTRVVAQAAPDGYTLLLGHTGTISINPSLYVHAGYRSAQGFRADRTGRRRCRSRCLPIRRSRPRSMADVIAHGQEGSGQAQSRHFGGRHRRLHVRRIVQGRGRRRCRDHSVQRHGAGDERPARRPCADGFRRAAAGARQYPGRQAARHRSHQQEALLAAARCADLRRSRDCPVSRPCCITACWRRPARRRKSSTSSTRNCASWSTLPDVQKQIHNEGGDPLTSTPAEYAADIDKEETKWGGLVKKLGLKVE